MLLLPWISIEFVAARTAGTSGISAWRTLHDSNLL